MSIRTERSERILGLELGGSKSARTAFVAADWLASERRLSIIQLQVRIEGNTKISGDRALLDALASQPSLRILAVNAPLTKPPCLECELVCPGEENCTVPMVEWMRTAALKAKLIGKRAPTPYTQRPLDIALRAWLPPSSKAMALSLDESYGSARAPLALRLDYLRRHLRAQEWQEVHPRLALLAMGPYYNFSAREMRKYRELDEGVGYRLSMLEKMREPAANSGLPYIDLFQRDLVRISAEIDLFDAFLACLAAALRLQERSLPPPPGFRLDWGWLLLPGEQK